jgi:hypothetical protein
MKDGKAFAASRHGKTPRCLAVHRASAVCAKAASCTVKP